VKRVAAAGELGRRSCATCVNRQACNLLVANEEEVGERVASTGIP
jgi:hypothetical protein